MNDQESGPAAQLTEDQAQANLEQAIGDYLHTCMGGESMPTDWVVVVGFDSLNAAEYGVATFVSGDNLALQRQLGLLEYAAVRTRKRIAED